MVAVPGLVSGQESSTHTSPVATAMPTAAAESALGDASKSKAYAARRLDEAQALSAGSAEAVE